mmetsp:Transcript_14580/g.27330  ORF Transcript_14580/g.27330 Transcript_14580/m.27330 type:complete len:256 (+) Transcript_14580:946-1713(+)
MKSNKPTTRAKLLAKRRLLARRSPAKSIVSGPAGRSGRPAPEVVPVACRGAAAMLRSRQTTLARTAPALTSRAVTAMSRCRVLRACRHGALGPSAPGLATWSPPGPSAPGSPCQDATRACRRSGPAAAGRCQRLGETRRTTRTQRRQRNHSIAFGAIGTSGRPATAAASRTAPVRSCSRHVELARTAQAKRGRRGTAKAPAFASSRHGARGAPAQGTATDASTERSGHVSFSPKVHATRSWRKRRLAVAGMISRT